MKIYGNHNNQTVVRELHALEALRKKKLNNFILQSEHKINPDVRKGFAGFTNYVLLYAAPNFSMSGHSVSY